MPEWVLNEEAIEAWNGVLFDRFLKYRHIVIDGLTPHGEVALRHADPRPGERVLDVGCGFGDTARRLAELVGPGGEVVGVDAAVRFVETAREESEGIDNVRFLDGDVQFMDLEGPYDLAFSRFGTMFFVNPVAALRNVRGALRPGGRLAMSVWRRKLDNPWLHEAELAVKPLLTRPEETDEPTCGPGPFSMADADTTSAILLSAGFTGIGFHRVDLPYLMGRDMEEAIELVTALGPAAEAIRLAGEEAEAMRSDLTELLRETLARFETPDGVVAEASTWVVTASAP